MGFDNECILNIQSLPGEYFCPVCRTLIYPNEAVQSQCTHLYCKPCLAYVVATTKACPYDGYLVTETDSKGVQSQTQADGSQAQPLTGAAQAVTKDPAIVSSAGSAVAADTTVPTSITATAVTASSVATGGSANASTSAPQASTADHWYQQQYSQYYQQYPAYNPYAQQYQQYGQYQQTYHQYTQPQMQVASQKCCSSISATCSNYAVLPAPTNDAIPISVSGPTPNIKPVIHRLSSIKCNPSPKFSPAYHTSKYLQVRHNLSSQCSQPIKFRQCNNKKSSTAPTACPPCTTYSTSTGL
ncbi:hypothetical protein PR202_gb04198 [Eleusine coracana subsp. coracana]|uniref:RING-type domain-containing protein n=1 Tax=Eleusine coracana subsp. coracana TaxID=191504 RepID=A0AAV5E3Q7_ELECO|nr:hypothetical protein PR202_gb04198 [Eleusine coracana subsp. coracana]